MKTSHQRKARLFAHAAKLRKRVVSEDVVCPALPSNLACSSDGCNNKLRHLHRILSNTGRRFLQLRPPWLCLLSPFSLVSQKLNVLPFLNRSAFPEHGVGMPGSRALARSGASPARPWIWRRALRKKNMEVGKPWLETSSWRASGSVPC